MNINKINSTQIQYEGVTMTLTYTTLINGYENRSPLVDIEMDNGGIYTFNYLNDTIDGVKYNTITDFINRIYA